MRVAKPIERQTGGFFIGSPVVQCLYAVHHSAIVLAASVADWVTPSRQVSEVQAAAIRLLPQALHIGGSICHLVDGAFVYGAMVLLRPIVERVATASYLRRNPARAKDWARDWKGSQRPSFAEMVGTLDDGLSEIGLGDAKELLHGLVHGNSSCDWASAIDHDDGRTAIAAHRMPSEGQLADYVSLHATTALIAATGVMTGVFPEAIPDERRRRHVEWCASRLLPVVLPLAMGPEA